MSPQNRSEQTMQEAREAIRVARQTLEAITHARTQDGAPGTPAELRAHLESQLSAEDIAQVEARVQEEVARIRDDIKARQMHSSKPTAGASTLAARRTRQII